MKLGEVWDRLDFVEDLFYESSLGLTQGDRREILTAMHLAKKIVAFEKRRWELSGLPDKEIEDSDFP